MTTICTSLAAIPTALACPRIYCHGHAENEADNARPTIVIDTDESRVVDETIMALQADAEIYQRGGQLVRVLDNSGTGADGSSCFGSPIIAALPAASLRERMTQFVRFTKQTLKGGSMVEVPVHPPPWLVSAIRYRGVW